MAKPTDKSTSKRFNLADIKLTARPDIIDFRDRFYQPTLREVPVELPLPDYLKHGLLILDQGKEGACTGFALAAVVNFLLKTRSIQPDNLIVSEHMLYANAQRYDEWVGADYEGSSARGAMKGWHKHGVCKKSDWKDSKGRMSRTVAVDGLNRPLGAYYRIKTNDLVAIHNALAEVGIVYATGTVHTGWERVVKTGRDAGKIPFGLKEEELGGHAFAIVGYTRDGFWIQNSWSDSWGHRGFALITYDDWLKNGSDVWVARLGVPIELSTDNVASKSSASRQVSIARTFLLRPHVISIGNNGQLDPRGEFGTNQLDLKKRFGKGSTFESVTSGWDKKRIILYAHGGLVGESAAVETLSRNREAMLNAKCYPVMFVWHSDGLSTLSNIIKDAFYGDDKDESRAKSFDWLSDRLDETVEVVAKPLGQSMWSEMKENATLATRSVKGKGFTPTGGAKLFLDQLFDLMNGDKSVEVHMVGHSAGSIFLAGMIDYFRFRNDLEKKKNKSFRSRAIESCSLWAPACTVALFKSNYEKAIKDKTIKRTSLFTLSDSQERDDTTSPLYRKSLLYLVSNSFEERATPFKDDHEEILGMEKFAKSYESVFSVKDTHIRVVGEREVQLSKYRLASSAKHHGDFDNDRVTLESTLDFILDHPRSASRL